MYFDVSNQSIYKMEVVCAKWHNLPKNQMDE
jgi:hypothetical protein